jgi:hypothetical protein
MSPPLVLPPISLLVRLAAAPPLSVSNSAKGGIGHGQSENPARLVRGGAGADGGLGLIKCFLQEGKCP